MRAILSITGVFVISSCGLDVPTGVDTRYALRLCTEEVNKIRVVMCTALFREAQKLAGPIVVIETGIDIFQRELDRKNIDPANFLNNSSSTDYARANIFAVNDLSTGQFATLDGKNHAVTCNGKKCRIDDAIEGVADRLDIFYTGGKLYSMNGILPF